MKKILSLMMTLVLIMTVVLSFTGSSVAEKINPTINVSADNISYELSDTLYGLSLDNTGYAIDGGLVAELVNNNSFEYSKNPTAGWSIKNSTYASFDYLNNPEDEILNTNNRTFMQFMIKGNGSAENFGYTEIFNNKSFQLNSNKLKTASMGFVEDETYVFSAFFNNFNYAGTISVSLKAEGNTEKYLFNIDGCEDWTKVSLELKSEVTAKGSLLIEFEGNGTFNMDLVSLVPKSSYGYDSWTYTSLNPELYNAIKRLSPSFIRFYEHTLEENDTVFGWKDSIGPLEGRKQISKTYKDADRFFINSNAMGFYEYLVLCEELDAIPIPVFDLTLYSKSVADVATLGEEIEQTENSEEDTPNTEAYVQNILDFIEYATGDETTEWGAKRVEDGHTKPFHLKYIAVDDKTIDGDYLATFDKVYTAVSEKYPELKIIVGSGKSTKSKTPDTIISDISSYHNVVVSEYFGSENVELYQNVHRFDDYERSSAQIAVDSFSSDADGFGSVITQNNIWSAIENAAFLTSLERNADLVQMASYKTMLTKRNAQQEKMSLVWFDSHDVLFTADYYSQMILANNMGTNYISTDFNMEDDGIYHSTTVDTTNKVIYVKLVNTTSREYKFNINLEGFKNVNNPSAQYMSENFKSAYNDFDEYLHVAPSETSLIVDENTVAYNMGGYSVNIIRIPYDKNDGSGLYALPEMEIVSPYIHPMVENIVPIVLVALVLVTGVIILVVRINRHKTLRKDEE